MGLALLVIAFFDLAGEVASRRLHVPLPGPVVGMLLLLGALVARPRWAGDLERGGDLLLRNMALFFVPAGVGVVTELHLLRAEWAPIGVALVVSTLIGLVVASAAFALVARGRS
jgi:putative effector of murein hydrolase LrgA (UPF0299 family)